MTRGGIRSIAVLAAAALAALLLAACGSSDSGSSSTAGSSTTETSAQDNGSGGGTEGENDAGEGGQEQGQSGSGAGGGSGKKSSKTTGYTAAEVETPLKVSGGGAEQFRSKGGDNSIQEFGEEKGESELQEAAEAVHGFFVARATGEWAKACGYLSKAMTEQLEQLAANSTSLSDKGCASFLEAFTSELPASTWRETTAVDAGSLRQEGEQAFLIYYGEPDKTVYAMPMKVEDGEFKVGALSGDALS